MEEEFSVPKLSKDYIELKAEEVIEFYDKSILSKPTFTPLMFFVDNLSKNFKVEFNFKDNLGESPSGRKILGQFRFPKTILISYEVVETKRFTFILAHEMGHVRKRNVGNQRARQRHRRGRKNPLDPGARQWHQVEGRQIGGEGHGLVRVAVHEHEREQRTGERRHEEDQVEDVGGHGVGPKRWQCQPPDQERKSTGTSKRQPKRPEPEHEGVDKRAQAACEEFRR